jgi:hypothetical protein
MLRLDAQISAFILVFTIAFVNALPQFFLYASGRGFFKGVLYTKFPPDEVLFDQYRP